MLKGQKRYTFLNLITGELKKVRGRNISDAKQRVHWGKNPKALVRIEN